MNVLAAKDPNADTEYAIDARAAIITAVRRDWPYSEGAVVKHPRHKGYYYEATMAGETSYAWPETLGSSWPVEEGLTVVDGSVEWTARHPSSTDLPTISSVSWDVDPSGDLSVDSDRIDGGIVYPKLTGGADGMTYEVTAHITWSTGQRDDITVVIPVAQQ